jgi:hypothetical protein
MWHFDVGVKEGWNEDGMSDEEYHKLKRWSSTMFKAHCTEHPYRAVQQMYRTQEEREDEEEKKSLRDGKIFHMSILEPEKFEELAIIVPKVDRRTKEGKAEWASFQAGIPQGAFLLNQEEKDQFDGMRESVERFGVWNPEVRRVFQMVNEVPGFATWNGNLPLKIKPDVRAKGCPLMLDFKTCADSLDFSSSIDSFNYMIQASYYCIVAEIIDQIPYHDWRWIAVSKKKPYEVIEWTAPVAGDGGLVAWKSYLKYELDAISQKIAEGSFPTLPLCCHYDPKPYMTPQRQITGGHRPWEQK